MEHAACAHPRAEAHAWQEALCSPARRPAKEGWLHRSNAFSCVLRFSRPGPLRRVFSRWRATPLATGCPGASSGSGRTWHAGSGRQSSSITRAGTLTLPGRAARRRKGMPDPHSGLAKPTGILKARPSTTAFRHSSAAHEYGESPKCSCGQLRASRSSDFRDAQRRAATRPD